MKLATKRLTRQGFSDFIKNPHKSVFNRLGTLKYSSQKDQPRLSVVVSSKHEKRAVYRNKLRRRIYTLFEQFQGERTAILYVSKQAYAMDYDEIKKLLQDLLARSQKDS